MRLRARLLVVSVLAAAPVVIGLGLTMGRVRNALIENALVDLVELYLTDPGARAACEADPAAWAARRSHGPTTVPDVVGAVPRGAVRLTVFRAEAPAGTADLVSAVAAGAPWASQVRGGATPTFGLLVPTRWAEGPCAYVYLERDLAPPRVGGFPLHPMTTVFLAPTAAFAAVLLAASLAVRRVAVLRDRIRASVDGDVLRPVAIDGDDEVAEVGRAFDGIVAQVDELTTRLRHRERVLRDQLNDTTHDVMVPLTVLLGQLDELRIAAEQQAPTDRALVASAAIQAEHLRALLDNLATAARLDGEPAPLRRTPFDAGAAIDRCVSRYVALARLRSVSLDFAVPEGTVPVEGDVTLFEQAIGNLVSNALRYGHQGGHVAVVLARDPGAWSVEVVDDGPGIVEAERAELLVRAGRGQRGRLLEPSGRGIGLTIVATVAARHGWTFTLGEAADGGGLCARVCGMLASD